MHDILYALVLLSFSAAAADFVVRVDARDVQSKRVHAQLTVPVKSGPLTLVYPKWLPGEHGPTGPLDSVIGLHIRANGKELKWTREPLDLFALRVEVPTGITRLDIALDAGLTIGGGDFTGAPTSSDRLAILAWNQFLLFPKGIEAEEVLIDAAIVAPAEWDVASALETTVAPGNTYLLETASIARLIDSPVQMGRHARRLSVPGSAPRAEIAHTLSIMADSEAALELPEGFAAGYARLVAEAGALFGTRMYRHYTWLLSLSDHVAHFGLEHHESSDNRLEERALLEADTRMITASLLGHEYVHSWNAKYRRPAGLLSPDYDAPIDSSLLWVYEGLTQFWGDVLATRAGLITPVFYREYLAMMAAYFQTQSGARWRPLVDTAVSAQRLYEAPSAWESARRGTDFYDASVFLWYDVDAELRAKSGGKSSLDDFMRAFYAGAAGAPAVKPYVEGDVYAGLTQIAPNDWRAFVHKHLDEPDVEALLRALARTGWRIQFSAEKNDAVSLREKRAGAVERWWSMGLRLDEDGAVLDTDETGAAARAGLGPGMKVLAVNERRYTPAVLDDAIVEAQRLRKAIAVLVESADYYRTLHVEYYGGPRYPHLERSSDGTNLLDAVLAPRVE